MNYQTLGTQAVPSANIAVNKSRLKVYNNVGNLPTYYLKKGQEFQIELFNPTQDTIMAKISLNSKVISQGGLVLKPGERVFLDRYLDVAKKFMFDTYEVSSNNEEVKKAIEKNGDFSVEFYREYKAPAYTNPIWITTSSSTNVWGGAHTLTGSLGNYTTGTDPQFLRGSSTSGDITGNAPANGGSQNISSTSDTLNYFCDSGIVNCSAGSSYTSGVDLGNITLDGLSDNSKKSSPAPDRKLRAKKSKTMETGRVEEGSKSDQTFTYVNKTFEYLPFHVVGYKLLPISQKVNTTQDVNVRQYCTGCGRKQGPGDNFCAGCGKKQ